jgi:aminocarboxymuconate-semialdehyde decarboxylase
LEGQQPRENTGWRVRPETKSLANASSTYLHRFTYETISHSKRILEFEIAEVGAER